MKDSACYKLHYEQTKRLKNEKKVKFIVMCVFVIYEVLLTYTWQTLHQPVDD